MTSALEFLADVVDEDQVPPVPVPGFSDAPDTDAPWGRTSDGRPRAKPGPKSPPPRRANAPKKSTSARKSTPPAAPKKTIPPAAAEQPDPERANRYAGIVLEYGSVAVTSVAAAAKMAFDRAKSDKQVLMATRHLAMAGALMRFSEPLAIGTGQYAAAKPGSYLARMLDKAAKYSATAALSSVGIALIMQTAAIYGFLPAGSFGTLSVDELAQEVLSDLDPSEPAN